VKQALAVSIVLSFRLPNGGAIHLNVPLGTHFCRKHSAGCAVFFGKHRVEVGRSPVVGTLCDRWVADTLVRVAIPIAANIYIRLSTVSAVSRTTEGIHMPEQPEIETDKLDEEIHKELEREGGSFLKMIALTTALFAALAAVTALLAGGTVNEALVLKTEATRLQAEASDQWAAYQAKGIKSAIQQASESSWLVLGKQPPPSFREERQRYAQEQIAIAQVARNKERERDQKSVEADHLLHQHHRFADSVALFQVAIALGAVAALTRVRLIWYASIVVGLSGALLFLTVIL
jgi:hypothetical protein